MIRTTNRFLSFVFICLAGTVVVNNAFAAGDCSSSCGSSNLYNYTNCYYNGSKCRKCPDSSEAHYWFQKSADFFGASMFSTQNSYGKCGYNSGASNSAKFECGYMPITNDNCADNSHRRGYYLKGSDYVCSKCEGDLSNRYPVYYEQGEEWYTQGKYSKNGEVWIPIKYCHHCPSDLDVAGVKSCDYNGFICKDNYTRVMTSQKDPDMGNYCYKNGYECVCENDGDHYKGWDAGNGMIYCGSCNGERDAYDRSACGWDTFTCQPWAYKAAYKTRPSGSDWQRAKYGRYECRRCPSVTNGDTFGISYSDPYSMSGNSWSWSTTSRCTASQTALQTDSNGCKYKWENIAPDYKFACPSDNANCSENEKVQVPCAARTENYKDSENHWVWVKSDASYSTEELPNLTNMEGNNSCYYTGTKSYYNVPAGFGAVNNNTMIATCTACTGNKWNNGAFTTCQPLPAHSTVNADHTDFICDKGYFKSYDSCIPCPLSVDSDTDWDEWEYGTTDAAGATNGNQCYIPGHQLSNDISGVYYAGARCPFNSNFEGYYMVCINDMFLNSATSGGESIYTICHDALRNFAEQVLNIGTGYGQGDHWADNMLERAVTASNDCESVKMQGGYWAGAKIEGSQLCASSNPMSNAEMVRQMFVHPQYAVAMTCGMYAWTY